MHLEFSNDHSDNDVLIESKETVRKLLENSVENLLKSGWGDLVRWRQPLFAKNVEFSFPFISEGKGRVQIHMLLSFMDLLTIWDGVDARVSDVVNVTSPQRDMLVFSYMLLIPIENSRKVVQQHVRVVLRFNDDGLIERWDETWSYTTEEILEKVWNLTKYEDPDFGQFVVEPVRDELTENIHRVPREEGAARAFRKNVDEVVDFLARQFPRFVMRGVEMAPEEREKMYKYFSDDGTYIFLDCRG